MIADVEIEALVRAAHLISHEAEMKDQRSGDGVRICRCGSRWDSCHVENAVRAALNGQTGPTEFDKPDGYIWGDL